MAALRASGLVKRFETTSAVDGVGLEVAPGEIRGLLGPNGAGKTTLLRMLFGLVRPDAGRIELLGCQLGASGATPPPGVGGFVEDPSFYPYLSGRANLELLGELDGGASAAGIDAALERVDLGPPARDRVATYSTGMRQRLGIAAALLRSPRLLLLDEPTSGLDPGGARRVGALLRELALDGVAIVLSSHLIGEVEPMCDAFTLLARGRAVWDGSAEQLRGQAPPGAYALATSDDARALAMAQAHPGVDVCRADRGLTVTAREGELDDFVLALGRAGVAVRRLQSLASPLQSMFFSRTGDTPETIADAAVPAEPRLARRERHGRARAGALGHPSPGHIAGRGRARLPRRTAQAERSAWRAPARAAVPGRPIRVRGDPQSPSRHPVRRAVRSLGARVGLCRVARGPRVRGGLGLSPSRGRGGRRHVLRRGPVRNLEDVRRLARTSARCLSSTAVSTRSKRADGRRRGSARARGSAAGR